MYAMPAVVPMTETNPRKGRELIEGFDPKRFGDDAANPRRWQVQS